MVKLGKSTIIKVAVAILLAAVIPLFFRSNRYLLDVFINLGIFVILGSSLNLMLGFTGQISMGQAAFFGLGAYTATLLCMRLHVPFIPAMIGAVILCFGFGFIFGIPSTRLNTIFLSIATVGLNRIMVIIFTNWRSLTNGATGILNIPQVKLFGQKMTKLEYYYMTLLFTLFVLLMCYRIVRSKTGRAFMSIKNNVIAASAMGINVNRYKLLVFAIGAAFSGIAGTLYAFNIRYIQPEAFNSTLSIKILTMSVIGGMGDLTGAVIGSLVVGALPELLRDFAEYQLTIYGLAVVLVLRFMPGGIISVIRKFIAYCKKKLGQVLPGSTKPPRVQNTAKEYLNKEE